MQTTLRIRDDLYREAKAQAALEGSTLTKFIEDGIRLRLGQQQKQQASKPFQFRVYTPDPLNSPFPFSNEDLKSIDNEERINSPMMIPKDMVVTTTIN